MVVFDGRGRKLSQEQLKAIFAKGRNMGISEKEINKKKIITSINDEIIAAKKNKEKDPIDKALMKVFQSRREPLKISDEILMAIKNQKELERKQKILIEMTDLQNQRADLIQQQLNEERKRKIQAGIVQEPPLNIPGLVSQVSPLSRRESMTRMDKIARRAIDIELLEGKSARVALEQARKEFDKGLNPF